MNRLGIILECNPTPVELKKLSQIVVNEMHRSSGLIDGITILCVSGEESFINDIKSRTSISPDIDFSIVEVEDSLLCSESLACDGFIIHGDKKRLRTNSIIPVNEYTIANSSGCLMLASEARKEVDYAKLTPVSDKDFERISRDIDEREKTSSSPTPELKNKRKIYTDENGIIYVRKEYLMEEGRSKTYSFATCYYNNNNETVYVGDAQFAKYLIVDKGIKPEYASDTSKVSSIGWCEKEQKFYGWSHRCMVGFGVGDKIYEEMCPGCDSRTPFTKHGTRDIENTGHARIAAIAFADSVS